jgi:hypothetical protein
MLLRGSGEREGKSFNLPGVTGASDDAIGVDSEDIILALTDAVVDGEVVRIGETRAAAVAAMGAQATVDVITGASGFKGITRVANATGIPLDTNTEETTVEMRRDTGIDEFAEASKAVRFV